MDQARLCFYTAYMQICRKVSVNTNSRGISLQ
ncbi:hypothetical protein T12_3767 [Trichinella patagoniensis]|uniref:Uncharacterized protein n=1 Tax=Trichinella patagoniensis TaxID=990121 RepID=A0A0V0YT76_9BILA|nr:hypothetical protein T12_3767 [Trichinella patagoniensis]